MNLCALRLQGDITAQQATALERLLPRIPEAKPTRDFIITLNSDGGDIDAAMTIGRILRAKQGKAYVNPRQVCASACVFVLAGALERRVHGPVVIHRPYRAVAQTNGYKAALSDFQQRSARIRSYLGEMNIPSSLYDAMLAIPSESGRRLSDQELAYYGIGQDDPVWAEEQDAAQAKWRGLSMPEYLRRKGNVQACWFDKYQRGIDSPDTAAYQRASRQCESLWQ